MLRTIRSAAGAAVLTAALLSVLSCSESPDKPDAPPCGGCGEGEVCGEAGVCISLAEDCSKSCAEAGKECGEHCGQSCGSCAAGTACMDGQCSCEPSCLGLSCGDPDGCGGECGPCASDQNCSDCALKMYVVERELVKGTLVGVTLAIDYLPPTGSPLAGIADLRLKVTGPAEVARVGLAQSLTDLGKDLSVDSATGRAWRTDKNNDVQLLLLSPRTAEPITSGRLAVLRFKVGTTESPARIPVAFSLVQREKILAPKAADEVLWTGGFGEPVSVWPEVNGEQ